MKASVYGEKARSATGLREIELIPGKHFPHEDEPAAMAEHIARIASSGTSARATEQARGCGLRANM
jgi:hypothetical protein